ncbi:MAG TPA: hypothetical protein VHG51_17580 [Longimicrobiaceae bacterium]|nr:hypothetical protein [Longimicrobiaceae bacterium]
MEPHENKQLALQKAVNAHEQAAAALTDLMDGPARETYRTMMGRIEQNIADLRRVAASSKPGDHV